MNKISPQRFRIVVRGRVQGVGFRYAALEMARKTGLTGYAKNLPDGSVEIEVQGEAVAAGLFRQWCREGPPRARVDTYFEEELPLSAGDLFQIR